MKQLTTRDRELVALGAAMGSNCVPCIEYHIPKAAEAGLGTEEISEAIRLADTVRQVPARKVLEAATKLLPDAAPGTAAAQPCATAAAAAATAQGSARCCG